ncbi:MAG: 30S ribosome-binding factor RbfA [Phycisphaerae bacterium]
MASHRVERMASIVRTIVADAIRNKLNDPRIAPLSSVTRVEMSGDLQVAKVFVSVPGSDAVRRRTLAGLTHARGHIQRIVAHSLSVRQCPEIRLKLDDSLKLAAETMRIIEQSVGQADDAPGEEEDDKEQEES